MTKVVEKVITKEDEIFIYGDAFEDDVFTTSWVKYKKDLWFVKPISLVLSDMGLTLDPKRCEEIENILDGNLNGFYYISNLNEESVKWFLGAVMAESKTTGKHFSKIVDAYTLGVFGEYIMSGKIDRTFSKDIFKELLDIQYDYPIIDDMTIEDYEKYGYDKYYFLGVRKHPKHILDDILKNSKYQLSDDSEVDAIIDKVINDNPVEVEKAKTDAKMINWFVGQCMKAGKGKLSPQVAKDKILARLG